MGVGSRFHMEKKLFEKRVRKLRKDFQKNVQPFLKRNRYHLSRAERVRLKHRKAIKRLRRAEARAAQRRYYPQRSKEQIKFSG